EGEGEGEKKGKRESCHIVLNYALAQRSSFLRFS
ncbi:hypothetical protein LCGC14_2123290, partial [marine sediment metagenome]